jgi:hypothetical protein
MRRLLCAALTVGLVAAGAPVRADDAMAARAIVDKAIKAHGGGDALKKYQGSVSTFKGTFSGMGMEIPITGDISICGGTKVKVDIQIDAGGQTLKVVNVVNADKGWTKLGDAVTELDKDAVKEAGENLHGGWVASLAPLVDGKGYTLAATGEHEVGAKKAVGVKVTAKGRRDVDLYFDKDTGLLIKYAHTVKDEGSGQEVLEETTYTEFKEFSGLKQAVKLTTKRDGKPYMDAEVSDVQLSEKLDDGVFVKP